MASMSDEKRKTKELMKSGIKAIFSMLKPYKANLVVLVVLGLISASANGFVPYITGRFFDSLIDVSRQTTTVIDSKLPIWAFLLIGWSLTQLVANNIDWVMDRIRRKLTNKVFFKIQADGFLHLLKLPMSYHKSVHINGDLQKISQASWRVSTILSNVTSIAPQLLSILIGIVLAATINKVMAGVLLAGVLLYVILLIKILLPIAKIDSEAHNAMNEGWDDAAASVQQIESVKQASSEDYEESKIHKNLLVKASALWMRLDKNWSNVEFFQRTIVFLTQLCIFILSVKFVSDGIITVGQLVALNGYSMMFFGPFVFLGNSWQVIQNGITAAAKVQEIFDVKEEVYVPEDAITPTKVAGKVEFKDVTFGYGEGQPDILHKINLSVEPGQVVALVGESGVGKSTSISLISGYYFPNKGNVLVDGIDTRRLNLTKLRQYIGVVPQEVALFNDTLSANIKYGTFGATEEDVINASREAHMEDFVENFPQKYETIVGERGVKLSVGQKQRVAIARAILRNPSILILDEPTSALDAKTEKIVTGALEKLMKGKTTFIIAHRLSTVRKADLILVFEKGKIVEQGTHEELLQKEGGVYRHLYDYQIGLH